ncbi:hypothetical protein, partial [Shigella sonnei]|uniref:hypothetical protein n=1 Tax=Shigella sonnei TaxID=624 RepID=UPI001C2E4A08
PTTHQKTPNLLEHRTGHCYIKTRLSRRRAGVLRAARREKTSEARQFFRHQVSKQSFKPGNSFSFLHQK